MSGNQGDESVQPTTPRSGRSGCSYDLVMEPAKESPPTNLSPRPGESGDAHPLTEKDIDTKLKEAEERRQTREQALKDKLQAEHNKHAEHAKEVEEQEEKRRAAHAAQLAKDLEESERRRKDREHELEERLKNKERHAEEVRHKRESMRHDSGGEGNEEQKP